MPNQPHVHEDIRVDPRAGGLIDAGSTPLLFLHAFHQEESFLRSTLPQYHETARRADSVFEQPHAEAKASAPSFALSDAHSLDDPPTPSYITSFTPINRPPRGTRYSPIKPGPSPPRVLPTDSASFAERYERRIPQLRLDFVELEENQLQQLDKDEDRVYHLNHERGGAYSGTFLKSSRDHSVSREYKAWMKNKLGRKLEALRAEDARRQERRLRSLLQQGHYMLIEQTTALVGVGCELECSLQGCLSEAENNSLATYYVISHPSHTSRAGPHAQIRYCLKCLEWLWRGGHTEEHTPLAHPGIVSRRESPLELISPSDLRPGEPNSYLDEVTEHNATAMSVNLTDKIPDWGNSQDFEITTPKCNELLAPFLPTPPKSFKDTFETTDIEHATGTDPSKAQQGLQSQTDDSPRSTTSDGEWLHPPTSLQYIASFIMPGVSISSKEDKAVMWLWKAASQAQLQRERHLRKYRQTQAFYDGRSDDDGSILGPDLEIEETEYSDEVIEGCQNLSRLKKEECYGNDISEVLYRSKQRRREG